MNNMRLSTFLGIFFLCFSTLADAIEPLDLKPFVGKSQFDRFDIKWLLPTGRQVANGVPFQIDGIIELYGSLSTQREWSIRTNVNGIPVGKKFDELHLLTAACGGAPVNTSKQIAVVHFRYADGSTNSQSIIFRQNTRQWFGPRHEEDTPLEDARCEPAWSFEFAEAAKTDKRSRFFHTLLDNPSPEKVVQSISLESMKSVAGLLIAGISVGPKDAAPLPNTLPNLPPDPVAMVRSGELISMEGTVADATGKPLADVTVRIIGVRGMKEIEDSRYTTLNHPTVGTETKTDAKGTFHFSKVPDDRLYRVLFVIDGLAPSIFPGIDPKRGAISVRLKPEKEVKPAKKFYVHGKITNPDNKPVLGAVVQPLGIGVGNSTSWGSSKGFEEVHTGSNGEFIMQRDEAFTRLQVIVETPGFASERIWLPAGGSVQTVQLDVGATLIGTVVKDDKPVTNATVVVSGSERSSEVYAGNFTTKTDEQGRFEFQHLPANTSWQLYGLIDSFKTHGSLPPRKVMTGEHGSTNDLRTNLVKPGLRLAGQVKSVSEQPFPPKMTIYAGTDAAYHSAAATTDENGNFEFTGLYPGLVEISISSSEWSLTPRNRNLDEYNAWQLVGKIHEDKTDLLLLVEKKKRDYNSHYRSGNGQLPFQDSARNRSLYGAEESGPPWVVFGGKIVDEETGQPVRNAIITPGRKPPVAVKPAKPLVARVLGAFQQESIPWNERIYWEFWRAEKTANGQFEVPMMPMASSTSVLLAEAEGYEPVETEPLPSATTSLVIKLSRGSGPKGIILQPDGKPAQGSTIIFAGQGEQYSLGATNQLHAYSNTNALRKVGADGRYTFPARQNGERLFVSHATGWANVKLSRLPDDGEITLEPWAAVTGTLVTITGAPAAGMDMALTMWRTGNLRDEAFVNLQKGPVTDAKGRFTFLQIPPGPLQLHRMVPTGGPNSGSRTYVLQTPFFAEAGKTNDLGNVTLDTPPPPNFVDQLKRKLGL